MKLKLFALIVLLQSIWVIGMVARQESRLSSGTLIMLETRPVDPRDFLRGDYVILGYDISSLPSGIFTEPVAANPQDSDGQQVYVELHANGGFHRAIRASLNSFTPAKGNLLIKGRMFASPWRVPGSTTSFRVEYGLERYYVREGTGNPRGKITVEASVSNSGEALIRRVFVDGKPYSEAMKLQDSR